MGWLLGRPLGRMFIVSLAIYAAAALLGYVAAQGLGGGQASRSVIRATAELLAPLARLDPPAMMAAIFLNNALKALAVFVLGLILGIVPFIFLVVNGLLTGLVVGEVGALAGPGLAFAALAPHGVIEVPALLLASSLGFRLAVEAARRVRGREARPGRELKRGLALYLKVVLPALLVGAAVEAFLTPLLISSFP